MRILTVLSMLINQVCRRRSSWSLPKSVGAGGRRLLFGSIAVMLVVSLAVLFPALPAQAAPASPITSAPASAEAEPSPPPQSPLIDPLYNPATIERLKAQGLTTPHLTSHRLTQAHLFTERRDSHPKIPAISSLHLTEKRSTIQ